MKPRIRLNILRASIACAISASAVLATAQGLEEVVVTATKREQNLNEVGLSISAFSGDELKDQRVSTVADLAKITPGLTFAPTPNATPVYTMRGVGFYEPTLAAYPDVSLYLDQIPLSLPVMSSLTAFDLERVEVLKGPQGTLFGNNATGGAINFVAAKPTDAFEAGVEVGYGRFDTVDTSAFVSGPLTEAVKARAALKAVKGDEWQKSYTREDELGKTENYAARVILDWDVRSDLKASLNVNAWANKDEPQAPQYTVARAQFPVGSASFAGAVPADWPILNYQTSPSIGRAADWSPNHRPYQDNRFSQGTLRMDYDLSDTLSLISLTGYSDLDFENATDGDGAALSTLDLDAQLGRVHSFTQELRVDGTSQRTRYTVGLNYEHTKANERIDLHVIDSTANATSGFTGNSWGSDQEMNNYAVFANIEYDLSDQLTFKIGARQTKAKRKATMFPPSERDGQYPDGAFGPNSLTAFFNLLNDFLYSGSVAPIEVGNSIALDTRVDSEGAPVDPATYMTTGNPHGELDEDSTSWSIGLDYSPTNSLLLYANISKGFKAGSFPTLAGAIYDAFEPVTQESLVSYELGFKKQLMDDRVSLSGAAFYSDYKDKQLRAKFVDPIFGALDKLLNVPESTIKGVELNGQAYVLDGLSLSASVSYLDTQVDDYDGVVGSTVNEFGLREPVLASFAGVELPFSPKWQYAARAKYEFSLSSALAAFFSVGVHGQSASNGTLSLTDQDEKDFDIPDRTLVDASLGVMSTDGHWKVSVWGKNLTDEYYWNQAVQAYDNVVRYAGRPAEYGVSLALKF